MKNTQSLFSLRNLIFSLAVFAGLLTVVTRYAEPVLRISIIPEGPPMMMNRNMQLLAGYLERKIGMKVEYRPKRDGSALIESLLYKELDLVWIDGARLALARSNSHGGVASIVQRKGDAFVLSTSVGAPSDHSYTWVIREGLDAELRQKLTNAFLTMGAQSIQ